MTARQNNRREWFLRTDVNENRSGKPAALGPPALFCAGACAVFRGAGLI